MRVAGPHSFDSDGILSSGLLAVVDRKRVVEVCEGKGRKKRKVRCGKVLLQVGRHLWNSNVPKSLPRWFAGWGVVRYH